MTRRDLGTALGIALVMGCLFSIFGGIPLQATFVPGVLVTSACLLALHHRLAAWPDGRRILPLFFVSLLWQMLHFAEEWATGFPVRFPDFFGADPIPLKLFVGFNLISYAVFAVSALAAWRM